MGNNISQETQYEKQQRIRRRNQNIATFIAWTSACGLLYLILLAFPCEFAMSYHDTAAGLDKVCWQSFHPILTSFIVLLVGFVGGMVYLNK